MSSNFGRNIHLSVFGQSHGEMIGAVIDGLPVGEEIDLAALQSFVDRRSPGNNEYSTTRKEKDQVHIVSGLYRGKTCGAPLCLLIQNGDTRSGDYRNLLHTPRPAHADYTAGIRYSGFADPRGGGHFSGRLTAPLTAAGGICLQILQKRDIHIGAHLFAIGDCYDKAVDSLQLTAEKFQELAGQELPVFSPDAADKMRETIRLVKEDGDSIGGIIEAFALGMPAGWGSPMFDGVENRLASALFAVPAVKGVEFGSGFSAAGMRGSEHNDAFCADDAGRVVTKTNNHGGILGGITSGMPIVIRVAIKPTPSISRGQITLNTNTMSAEELKIKGRHDPCIVPRAVPCIEAVTGLVLMDLLLDGEYKELSL